LFLEMVRSVGEREPKQARAALSGLVAYQRAARPPTREARPIAVQIGPATLLDFGGEGSPAVLVPSLINPPDVLDLDEEVSLASAIARMGRRALLLDWGAARERFDLGIGGHVTELLMPLLTELDEPAALVGYCLGGTMTIAAANLARVASVATIASPWRFSGYPADARASVGELWLGAKRAAASFNLLPMEVLQAAFWSLDPDRTVTKFARFSELDPQSAAARRFVVLEDWANEGEPLPLPAARELIEDFFGLDLPGNGAWQVAGRAMSDKLPVPVIHFTADHDLITPGMSAAHGEKVEIEAGHVGMVVGSARQGLHHALGAFLAPCR
jgi:polyhydroxyalkanoate synthase